MSVPEQVPYKEYRATGSNNSFEITFYLPDPKDLVVMVNKEIPPVGAYSIQDNTVVFNTPPNEGDLVELTRDTQLDRETNFKSYDNSFRPETINFDLDKIWLVLQESNLVDAKILARLKQEIEWRRTHDFNYDELAQVREKQIFNALKGYADTLYSATNPNVFAGVIAGVVFARDGKSIQTHIEEILDSLALSRSYVDEQLSLKAPQATTYNKIEVDTKIDAETTRAQIAEQVLQNQLNAVGVGNKAYLTYAEMDADKANNPANSKLEVTNDPVESNNGVWQWNGTTVTKSSFDPVQLSKNYTDELKNTVFSGIGKNLLDKSQIVAGEQYSPTTKTIVSSSAYRRSPFIPVVAGETYTLSGNLLSAAQIAWYSTADKTATAISNSTTKTATAPVGANFAVFNITNTGSADTTYDGTTQFEKGNVATSYEAYVKYIDRKSIYGLDEELSVKLNEAEIIENFSFNKIDPSKIDFVKRYSTGTFNFVNDTLGIAASDWIPVEEGEWYVISGDGRYADALGNCQGGYFTSYGSPTAVQNILWTVPVDGNGRAFKVPVGLGITHVVVSLKKKDALPGSTTLQGDVQLENGEMATAYQPFDAKPQIKTSLLPSGPGQGGGSSVSTKLDDVAWFKYTKADGAHLYPDKLPKFRKLMLLKDKDACVVMTGTSLTARTTEHCSVHPNAAFRPPMMHSLAFCSHIWDAIKWDGQQYRRYDASGYFTETGSFLTASNLTEWDDGPYRDGLTRYSESTNAAVQFTIPVDAWQFNFIYRTDSIGCTAKVAIAEGDGLVQVYDETTSSWLEANNYTFSMLESAPVTRSVNIPDPVTGVATAYTLASKGNTTYQKRLKMRCRDNATLNSLTSTKAVTISNTSGSGRFMYWGVEWSPRQFMITYINSSRGSHNTNATSASGLPRYQDNEVWGFKPDLILSELAIHNDGAAAAAAYPVGRWAGLAHNYVTNADYELSMYSRAAHFGLTPEYSFFMGTITWNFGGINDDGSLKYGLQTASVKGPVRSMSALDKYDEAVQFLQEAAPAIAVLNTAKRWVEAGVGMFGDMKAATVGSGKNGATFTNEGSHWNDTGSAVMAKAVLPLIK